MEYELSTIIAAILGWTQSGSLGFAVADYFADDNLHLRRFCNSNQRLRTLGICSLLGPFVFVLLILSMMVCFIKDVWQNGCNDEIDDELNTDIENPKDMTSL